MMLTIVWNPHGFHLIDVLPKGSKISAGHYISHVRSRLPEILAPYHDDSRRHFAIRTDNARLHFVNTVSQFLDHNSLRRALHSPYSSDLVPSSFWLFRYLKGVLQGSSFDETDELWSAIQEILNGVSRETLDVVFQEGMIRLQNVLMEMVNMLSDV
jgi:histone-lysine N-methyltransferase SETMAR